MAGEEAIILGMILGMFILIPALVLFVLLMSSRKTKRYRKEIMDMYVSSKIKQLATEDGLNIEEEYKLYENWAKKQSLTDSNKELDDVVEDNLKEEISEETLVKINKQKSK
jgi:hypothetical protein